MFVTVLLSSTFPIDLGTIDQKENHHLYRDSPIMCIDSILAQDMNLA